MSESILSQETALRIALASRALPDVTVRDLIEALQTYLGDEINEQTLGRITVTNLKTAFGQTYDLDGDEDGEDANSAEISALKTAVRILWGETDGVATRLPAIEPYQDGDLPGSIRVAIASNSDELLDGHFGSCLRYLIYQLSPHDLKLIGIRSAATAELSEDKNAYRVDLIKDCQVLFAVSIGGPAAAKVLRTGIYPMKKTEGVPARYILADLQTVMSTSPPPWLAKVMGVAGQRVKNYTASATLGGDSK